MFGGMLYAYFRACLVNTRAQAVRVPSWTVSNASTVGLEREMKKTLKKTLACASVALVSLAQPAQADQITQWSYDLYTRFAGVNNFSSGNGSQIQQLGQVSWGDPGDSVFAQGSERSGITIASVAGANQSADPAHVTGTYLTDNTAIPATGAWITHHNNAIGASYATLLDAVISSTLTLTYVTAGGGTLSNTIPFVVLFKETENVSGTCVASSPPGNPCNDIFALNLDNFDKTFELDGYTYYVNIFPTAGPGIVAGSLPTLGGDVCGAAGADPNCVGFTTVEGQDTSIQFGFTITSKPLFDVPEPGVLALFGIALLGGFAQRRWLS